MAIRIHEFGALPSGTLTIRPGAVSSQSAGTVGASSTQSSAFGGSTRFVTVQSDEACHVVFGSNPTATTDGFYIAAGGTEDFAVEPSSKVAWIQA